MPRLGMRNSLTTTSSAKWTVLLYTGHILLVPCEPQVSYHAEVCSIYLRRFPSKGNITSWISYTVTLSLSVISLPALRCSCDWLTPDSPSFARSAPTVVL
jgi:hypothetical protein